MVNTPDLYPLQALPSLVRRWWLITALAVVGGVFGLLFNAIRPQVYESASELAISVDYGRTVPLELIVEDRALDRVWALLMSDDTLLEATEALRAQRGNSPQWADIPSLRQHIRLENRLSRWVMIGIDTDPEVAQAIADAWGQTGLTRLQEAIDHAWKAFELQGGLLSVACLLTTSPQPAESVWLCFAQGGTVSAAGVQALRQEIAAGHGILPILSVEGLRRAEVPSEPVVWGRTSLILGGLFAGLLLGLAAALVWRPSPARPAGTPDQQPGDR